MGFESPRRSPPFYLLLPRALALGGAALLCATGVVPQPVPDGNGAPRQSEGLDASGNPRRAGHAGALGLLPTVNLGRGRRRQS